MKPGDLVKVKKNRFVYQYGYLYKDPHVTYYIRDLEGHETGVILDSFRRARYSMSYQVMMGGTTGWVEEKDIEVLR